jgi:hypothetical protein
VAMSNEGIKFPQYRRYKNGRSYFKIINPSRFEEIQVFGTKKILRITDAKLYPEKNFVHDLLFNYAEMAEEIGEVEYENLKFKIKN